MPFLNINIYNSFNKNDDSYKKAENVFDDTSTLNNVKNILETHSTSIGSITGGGYINEGVKIKIDKDKKGFWRDIVVGTISAVLSAVIMYFILGIK